MSHKHVSTSASKRFLRGRLLHLGVKVIPSIPFGRRAFDSLVHLVRDRLVEPAIGPEVLWLQKQASIPDERLLNGHPSARGFLTKGAAARPIEPIIHEVTLERWTGASDGRVQSLVHDLEPSITEPP